MRGSVFIIGSFATPVGRFADRSPQDLTRAAVAGTLADAGVGDGGAIGHIWFSNMLLDYWGQSSIKGQICLAPLYEDGHLPMGVAVTNVEGACASGSLAFNGAIKDVLAGTTAVSLAVGMEKMFDPASPRAILPLIEKGTDTLAGDGGLLPYRKLAAASGIAFEPGSDRSIGMDIYAVLAATHMSRYGTTAEHMACAAAKNHTSSVDNPRSQYRFPMDTQAVLADRVVSDPLTRAMCAPTGDGAAAVLVCSDAFLRSLPYETQRRAIEVVGHAVAGGDPAAMWEDDRAPVRASRAAYEQAGVGPDDLDVVELHDATSFAELHLVEDLGLCPRGEGGPFTASGATGRAGVIPVNPSGGLVSRGHPIGATGLMMLNEIVLQLRGEAGDIQIPGARLGLAENGGGLVGTDVAACAVTILATADSRRR
jgi:acetyl-CoA acetyltransferase